MNELGKKMLRKVIRQIKKQPELFDMSNFDGETSNSCETTHCIGGWLHTFVNPNGTYFETRQALDMSFSDWERLCFCNHWPPQFSKIKAPLWNPSIATTVARIKHFIATDGAE